MLIEFTQVAQLAQDILAAAPTPPPPVAPAGDGNVVVNTDGVLKFFITQVAPILCAFIGCGMIARSSRGDVGKVVTTSGISIVGMAFLGGAGALFFVGDSIFKMIFG
jgi:hypothetical protein